MTQSLLDLFSKILSKTYLKKQMIGLELRAMLSWELQIVGWSVKNVASKSSLLTHIVAS